MVLRPHPGLAAIVVALLAAGCGPRPTGDFNRARPTYTHDVIMPSIGHNRAIRRRESVSDFNLTDDERQLRDRGWTFVRAPQLGDWWQDSMVEQQRTRMGPIVDPSFDPRRYYEWLRAEPFRSSEARWSRVIEDAQGDTMLIPPFCEVAARVRRADVERLAALSRQGEVDVAFETGAYARVDENNAVMDWVWRALTYRLRAYRFAIDRLQVETPSNLLYDTNRAYMALAATHCEGAPAMRSLPPSQRPGRSWKDPFDGPVQQK
jgi:hypothetical protein